MSKIVLYWHPMSSATPVACALAELGVPHERVKVDITENLGGSTLIHARTEDGHPLVMSSADRLAIGSGDTLPLSFSAVPHVFDKDGNNVR